MQFQGKIVEALPVVTGEGARGQWVKQGFVLEYEPGQYPKQIAFDVFGSDKLQEMRISVGEELICDIDFKVVKGRNGGTFNNVGCWRVTRVNQVQQQQAVQQAVVQPQQQAIPQQAVQQQPQGCQPYYPDRQPQQAPPQQQPLYPPQGQPQQPVGDVTQSGSDGLPF
ncbi:MAG: DUF3127 domain-containing protein [Prevotella sp.]